MKGTTKGLFVGVIALGIIGASNATTSATTTVYNQPTNYNAVQSGNGQQQTIQTVITWYGFNDNSGQVESVHNSADIAYPKSGGFPTVHNQATEGTGTYNDPITFAAPDKDLHSSFPIGSIIYVPGVQKYFVMEDQCGDDDAAGCQDGQNHSDLYMGPSVEMDGTRLYDCEGNATPNSPQSVIINPAPNLPVDTNEMYTADNQCNVKPNWTN